MSLLQKFNAGAVCFIVMAAGCVNEPASDKDYAPPKKWEIEQSVDEISGGVTVSAYSAYAAPTKPISGYEGARARMILSCDNSGKQWPGFQFDSVPIENSLMRTRWDDETISLSIHINNNIANLDDFANKYIKNIAIESTLAVIGVEVPGHPPVYFKWGLNGSRSAYKKIRERCGFFDDVKNSDLCLLCDAVEIKDKEEVAQLIDAGVNPSVSLTTGWTALHSAAEYGDVEMVEMMLSLGIDHNAMDNKRRTPLLISRNHEVMESLLKSGSDPNHRSEYRSALENAIYSTGADGVSLLIAHGVDIHERNEFGKSALDLAVSLDRTLVVSLLISNGFDVNSLGFHGSAAIHSAKSRNMISLLVDANASLEAKHLRDTPLMMAARWNNVELMKDLLDFGANIDAKNNLFGSSLTIATDRSNIEAVRFLLSRGVDKTIRRGIDDKNAYEIAVEENNFTLQDLLKKFVSIL